MGLEYEVNQVGRDDQEQVRSKSPTDSFDPFLCLMSVSQQFAKTVMSESCVDCNELRLTTTVSFEKS